MAFASDAASKLSGARKLPHVLYVDMASGLPLRYTLASGDRFAIAARYRFGAEVDDPAIDRVTVECAGGITGGGSGNTIFRDSRTQTRSRQTALEAPVVAHSTNVESARRVFAVVDSHRWQLGAFGAPGNMSCTVAIRLNGRASLHYTTGQLASKHRGHSQLRLLFATQNPTATR